MITSFSIALTALNATSAAVNTVGNNLANLNTTGYKAESVQFAELMSQSLGLGSSASQFGLGVGPAQTVRQFSQGSIQQTSGSYDAAIQGKGFFIVAGQNGQKLYTRAGNFSVDASGMLQTASGQKVQGWNLKGGSLDLNSPVESIAIPLNGSTPAVPTSKMSLTLNLNAQGVVGETSGTYSTPIQVIDALGGSHTLTANFTKTGANNWDYTITVPEGDLNAGGDPALASGTFVFDGKGTLTSPAQSDGPITMSLAGLADGAADLTMNWDLFGGNSALVTQFAQDSGVAAVIQDGVPAGQITGVGIGDGGLVVANYSNGTQATVAQLALAAFSNPETMQSVGNNNLAATASTSDPAIGKAGSGGLGAIAGRALEASTVDIATEFTNLISFQRTYQANSRVISTTDQMTQDLIGLIR